jgi:hypothetical protein
LQRDMCKCGHMSPTNISEPKVLWLKTM